MWINIISTKLSHYYRIWVLKSILNFIKVTLNDGESTFYSLIVNEIEIFYQKQLYNYENIKLGQKFWYVKKWNISNNLVDYNCQVILMSVFIALW